MSSRASSQTSLSHRIRNSPCNTWVAINPPSPSNTSLAVEDSELVKAKLLLQLACHGNARSSSTHNDNGVVRVSIVSITVDPSYRFVDHLENVIYVGLEEE
jgi:hypothetical protein